MAIISSLKRDWRSSRPHRTVIEGFVQIVENDGHGTRLVQIATMGSSERESPPKASQTMQFTAQSAQELVALFREAYGDSVVTGPRSEEPEFP